MFNKINGFLLSRNRTGIALIVLLLVFVIGFLDYVTGYELSFSIFYLIPVSIALWYAGRRMGVFFSVLSAFIWLIVDYTSGNKYSNRYIIIWNASMRMAFFIITSYLLFRLKCELENRELLSRLDSLTGVMNVRAFDKVYDQIAKQSSRYNHPFTIGYIDLDNFKNVNDTLGHSEGDRILMKVASTLSTSVRSSDFVFRLGGDEFAVVLTETNLESTHVLFDKLLLKIRELSDSSEVKFGVSVGVGGFCSNIPSLNDALKFVDDLMYNVKKSGKNGILYLEYDYKNIS